MAEILDLQQRIWRLAGYNAEKSRGIVHTNEWVELMKREQEWFDGNETQAAIRAETLKPNYRTEELCADFL